MIEYIYKRYTNSFHVTIDSRNVKVGSIFFALKGENNDGNAFAADALKNGAVLAVIDNPIYLTQGCVLVDNSLHALQQLANYHRQRLNTKIFAITGSNGKTTTKELLFAVLSKKYKTKATIGNLNNHIGVPLTLLSLTPEVEFAIVEMGANHPGDIDELCRIAEPDFGLITNIGRAHLGGFGGFEGVINTKGELYKYLVSKRETIFYNHQNPILVELLKRYKAQSAIPYSNFVDDCIIDETNTDPFLSLTIKDKENIAAIQTHLVGNYNVENVMAAYAVGRYFGVDINSIIDAIEKYVPSNNRSQLIKTQNNTVIMDAYNANPSSMEHALKNFGKLSYPLKVVILGEMLELGEYSTDEHKKIADLASSMNFDKIFLVGKGFANINGNFHYFDSALDCANYLRRNPLINATVLVKGSRGVKLEQVINVL
ncbi:MAG TPA: UDP-N-acetylmuramoyl-tripeptide--D-alanyl-D-alanine ligase [Tenuifilum sp.]|uniref:UDP-N-acetylmuramoyl-tripeptide--D-alanyl-D- alanine ligase n=1 Tax=Tenuifilum sp. TaxID=2760880 RepID=UPI002CFCBC73|nr:UDP-N-acetylmuramoyl-tripeptide--D-alanyl-D-alanine ligase [Tenuifilum sp.]